MRQAEHLAQQVRELGPNFDARLNELTRAIYRPSIDLNPAGSESLDVPYGEHFRHRLDVYRPRTTARGTVIFIHGGGFVGGDKNTDGVFYVNLGRWLARNGWTAVLANYRLAPADAWPAGARDVQSIVAWVHAHSTDLAPGGASPIVWGQSVGAGHVASWLFDASARGGARPHASAVMLMSGFYRAEAPLPAGPRAYFGTDERLYDERSPLTHVAASTLPVWLGVAEFDPGTIAQHTYSLARALAIVDGRSADFHFFRGHNHVSTVQSLGSPQTDVADEVLRFMAGVEAANR